MMLTLSLNMTVFAAAFSENTEGDYKCIVKNDKIVDRQILMERAINQEHDAPMEVVESLKEKAVLLIDGVEQDETPLITTELLSEYSNGTDTVDTYAATIISEMNVENDMLRAASTYTKSESVGTNGEVSLYTTIKFVVEDVRGVGTIKLKSVSVRAGSNVSACKVLYAKARYGCKGINYDTRGLVNQTTPWVQSNTGVITVTANSPRLECVPGGVLYRIWGEGLARVKRGASSYWNVTHKVEESGMGWFM